jgi:nitrate reductase molybdenum cofactor assembly chaperone NarJ/NarW
MVPDRAGRLLQLFAPLLEYPTPALGRQAQECGELLQTTLCPVPGHRTGLRTGQAASSTASAVRSQAAALLDRFRLFVEGAQASRLEELYTATFDLQAVCSPYVGYHLFGESYKRGMFMARLKQGYREWGFSAGNELPDHVAAVLRFLALATDGDFSQTLLGEGLIPALSKMDQAFGDPSDNPYAGVIRALLLLLREGTEGGMDDA